MRSIACFTFIGAASLSLLSAGDARARPCASEADCPSGFDCFPSGDTADGGSSAGSCISLSCKGDSDCGAGTRCFFGFDTQCVTVADGGQSCGLGNVCVPQWQAPCAVDSDCGPGFTCSGSDGFAACGPNQDQATEGRPYAMTSVIPCSATLPPISPPWCNGADAGDRSCPQDACKDSSSCLSVHWNTCLPQQTGPCTRDSDCPATWSCQCPASCGFTHGPALAADAGVTTSDAGCTKACVAPNSDLMNGGDCFSNDGAVVSGPSRGSNVDSEPASDGTDGGLRGALDAGSARSRAASNSPRAHGGCQIVDGAPVQRTRWGMFAMWGVACWIRRRRRSSGTLSSMRTSGS